MLITIWFILHSKIIILLHAMAFDNYLHANHVLHAPVYWLIYKTVMTV